MGQTLTGNASGDTGVSVEWWEGVLGRRNSHSKVARGVVLGTLSASKMGRPA